jgi:hypothetical protein
VNRQRVDETESENDEAESGNDSYDSDDDIDEGQSVCPRHALYTFWLETCFILGYMGNVDVAPSGPCSGGEVDITQLGSPPSTWALVWPMTNSANTSPLFVHAA